MCSVDGSAWTLGNVVEARLLLVGLKMYDDRRWMALAPCCIVFGNYHVDWLLPLRWGEMSPPFHATEN